MNAYPIERPIAPLLDRPLRRPSAPEPALETDRGPIQELWAVVVRQWPVIATTVTLLVAATTLYCLLVTPLFLARATVQIEPRGMEVLKAERFGDAQDAFVSARYDYYQTQFELLRSPTLARRVIKDLGLAKDARFFDLSKAAESAESSAAPADAKLVGEYLRKLTVLPIRGTRLVSVEFESPSGELAAQVANAHARLFVKSGLERLYGAIEHVRGFLQSKLRELQTDMQRAETKLLRFQSKHQLLPVELGKDVASERLTDLSRRLTAAEADRIVLEAQFQLIERHEYDSLPAVLTNGLINTLRQEFDRLEVEHALLAAKFRPTYPRLQQLSEQLAHARDLLRREIAKVVSGEEANYRAAQRGVEQLKAELEAHRQSLLDRKDVEGEFQTLARDVETSRSLYNNLLARIKDLDVAGGANTSNIDVAEPAMAPLWPSTPQTKFNLVLSILTGLVLGSGIAFLRDTLDRRVRDTEDVRRAAGLGTLAVVPDFELALADSSVARLKHRAGRARRLAGQGWKRIRRIAANDGNDGAGIVPTTVTSRPHLIGNGAFPPSAEAYSTLRTSLLLARESSPRVLLVASAAGGEGKTTTAVNSAVALARCGATVLLIDGDMRLPRCHETLNLPLEPGLSDFLGGKMPIEPIQETDIANLSLLSAGRLVANPTELLTSGMMPKLLRHARERFDFIVIDSPPLLAVSDGLLLANLADGVMVVADTSRSRRDHLRIAVQLLRQTGAIPLGAVLNRGEVGPEYCRYGRPLHDAMSMGALEFGANDLPLPPAGMRG